MAQDDLMRWFYWRYVEDPKRYYSVKEVSRSTGLAYGICLRQLRQLAIFDMLKTFRPESIFINGYAKHLYRLHSNTRLRCKLLYSNEVMVQSYQNRKDNDTYISSSDLTETKKAGYRGLFNE
jgi:hypothetical protein